MAKGFKTGGRKKGSKNKPRELAVSVTERAATAGNARVHAKLIPALTVPPLEVMLENMNWAWNEANDLERGVTGDPNVAPEIRLHALKEIARFRDRAQSYAVKAAPYVHPRLHTVAPPLKAETEVVEVDPLREHLEEMAKVFRLESPSEKG
jgi:hypothetical protein